MTKETVTAAVAAAKLFLAEAAKITYNTHSYDPKKKPIPYIVSSPKVTGALRRKSMDLTRALAEMRKP